jgi:hypothetical protein
MTRKPQRARVWLATLSAVVGVATGMFTLRDQVFPNESGSAGAVTSSLYQQQVGRICDRFDQDDHFRAHQDVTVKRRLVRATTTTAQRNALLDAVRRSSARSGNTLAAFTALPPPKALAAAGRDARDAWTRNLARLRAYAERLDAVATRAQLVATIDYLAGLRTPLAEDGVKVRSGLERLGGADCDLPAPRVTQAFTLPPLHRAHPDTKPRQPTPRNDKSVNGPSVASPQKSVTPTPAPKKPSINVPAPTAPAPRPTPQSPEWKSPPGGHGSVNTPGGGATGGGGAGGGGDGG